MTRRHVSLAAVLLAARALALLAGTARATVSGAPEGRVANDERSFVTLCGFSHRNTGRPDRAARGGPGFSHDHTFVGNVSTDAYSTARSLHKAKTTCDRKKDTAAYWAPTLYDDGDPVDPYGAVVYYRRLTTRAGARRIPTGSRSSPATRTPARRRAGASSSGTAASSRRRSTGRCARDSQPRRDAARRVEHAAALPARLEAPAARQLPGLLERQDGRQRRPQAHMAYSRDGRCPRSHPVAVAGALARLPVPAARPASLALSSGGVYSAHADFLNAWDEEALEGARRRTA